MPNDNYNQDARKVAQAHDYHKRALAMFDQGFTSEAARKDALDYLNRAYETLVIEAIHYALWAQRTDDGSKWVWDNEIAKDLDRNHNVPALHVWAQKHVELYNSFPCFQSAVKIANVLRADRDAIKILPIKEKPKSRTRVLAEARSAVAKTCQICSRPILAERGKIAHHGYERPDGQGYQTASCFGALHLPFEVSRDRLGQYITALKDRLERTKAARIDVNDENTALVVRYVTKKYEGRHEVRAKFLATRESYDASLAKAKEEAKWISDLPSSYDVAKRAELKSLDRNIHEQELYLVGQEIRFNDWKPAKVVA